MNAATLRRPAPDTVGPWSEPGAMLALAAMGAYVLSTIKFVNRDPLSNTTGIQALIEIAAVAASAVLAAIPLVRSRSFPRPSAPAVGFALFAATALLSSAFSYWPVLSLIKGGMLVAILFVAIALCATRPPEEVLGYFYWSAFVIIAVGLCLKFVYHEPLFDIDEYSGRARFTVFALHPGSLADLSALAILIGRLVPRRPRWFFQLFLLLVNLATCARWSTASLILVMLASTLWATRITLKAMALTMLGAATAALAAWIVLTAEIPIGRIPFEQFYGDKVTLEEVTTLNGRTGVWAESESMIPGTILFGYGVEGARAAILRAFEWAGHAHNAYLEVLFAGGLPGLIGFLIGWGAAVVKIARTDTPLRPYVLSMHVYMFICGLTDPNITLLQFLPLFLIVCVDAARRVVREPVVLPAPVRRPAGVRGAGALVRVHPQGADA
jgi:exopolysaccharide production protein ExoQ